MKYEEKDIINLLKKGNVACVKMLFDNYYQMLCVFALRFLHSFEDAEDVVQDVFVDFWEKKKGTTFRGALKSYLFGAVQKAALYHERSAGHMVFEEIDSYAGLLADEISEEREEELIARKEKLYKEIQLLPEKCREVFMAIVLEGLSYKETAEKLDISVNTVKTHYARALKQLRDNLDTIILLFLLHGKISRSFVLAG
ncbi:RNA polymerase sigma factor [Butyricimonas synergistica]|uniref:RNA polymerase sigma factor n=1 Tax=Butyricimonas synergistica TaxID=544644 RepID=UPI0003A1A4F2|nr:RNA polymerase sigma-70 factor [Butyricimonas synergistica]